ncbi:MAG: hypothetical protein HY299_20850 [Verrucomicrobia bacterium]|nr:hypothetical protein [Verrucomicrobiota bacterium]
MKNESSAAPLLFIPSPLLSRLRAWAPAFCAFVASVSMFGAEPAEPAPPPPPPPPPPPVAPQPQSADVFQNIKSKAVAVSDDASEHLRKAKTALRDALTTYQDWVVDGVGGLEGQIKTLTGKRPSPVRGLVVPVGDPDPTLLREASEDLNIMARLLAKTIAKRSSEEGESSAPRFSFADRSRSSRPLLIQGSGALFVYHVGYPLVAPPSHEDEETAGAKTKASPWDETRRELYGRPGARRGEGPGTRFDGAMVFTAEASEPFDAEKVQMLKEDLIEALKQGANMRHLRPEETVTVLVIAPGARVPNHDVVVKQYTAPRGGTTGTAGRVSVNVSSGGDAEPTESTLMVRAKGADLKALAAGKLTDDAFKKLVKAVVY